LRDFAVLAPNIEFMAAGKPLGTLSVLPRKAETALTPRDAAVARAIAAAASPALDAVQATQQLVDARARLLVAREEERRTLRRDLHDDLAPTLVGLGLTASGIARMLHAEHSQASADSIAAIAEGLVDDLHGAIAQTREIAHGLRPPVLDERGLVEAIRARTVTPPDAEGLVVRVEASPDPMALPAAIEVSALRIVQEAVNNARRHAGATRCDVRLAADAEALVLEIVDDGQGMPAATSVGGLGLESMRERARELGGSLRVESSSGGGTLVRARLPLAMAGGSA
jgi:signal transduction histidine kinase